MVTNTGGASNGSSLTVNLPSQVSYQGFHVDRGPGCSASGQTISCNLDFFPPGQSSTVEIGAQVIAIGTATLTTSHILLTRGLRPNQQRRQLHPHDRRRQRSLARRNTPGSLLPVTHPGRSAIEAVGARRRLCSISNIQR